MSARRRNSREKAAIARGARVRAKAFIQKKYSLSGRFSTRLKTLSKQALVYVTHENKTYLVSIPFHTNEPHEKKLKTLPD